MTQTTPYHVYRVLVALAGLRGCLAIDIDPDVDEMKYFHNLPGKDREFLKEYLNFSKTTAPRIFYPIVIVCIVLGVIGNTCFVYFFANRESRVYTTKDALFFRRMSIVDYLVCSIVLPYAIFFEARVVTNNMVCRGMEFLRHVLIYSSHLLLTFYSLEFSIRDSYVTAKQRFNRTTIYVIIASVVLSIPTPILFEAGNPYSFYEIFEGNVTLAEPIVLYPIPSSAGDHQVLPSGLEPTDRLLYFNPKFCHLNLNVNNKAKTYTMIRYITTWYTMMHGFIFFISSFTLMAQIINLMELNPFIGRNSVFVNVIEQNYPELKSKLRSIEIAQTERRNQIRAQRDSVRAARWSTNTESEDVVADAVIADERNSLSGSVDPDIFGHSVDARNAKPNISSAHTAATHGHDDYDSVDPSKISSTQEIHVARSECGKASFSNEEGAELPLTAPPPSATALKKRVNWSCEPTKDMSLCQYLCSCQACRSQGKRVRLLGSNNRAPGTFRYSIMCLIMFDLLVLVAATLGYLISNEMSFILNLVNFKCVFSFFILSLINDDLYNVTWRWTSQP